MKVDIGRPSQEIVGPGPPPATTEDMANGTHIIRIGHRSYWIKHGYSGWGPNLLISEVSCPLCQKYVQNCLLDSWLMVVI